MLSGVSSDDNNGKINVQENVKTEENTAPKMKMKMKNVEVVRKIILLSAEWRLIDNVKEMLRKILFKTEGNEKKKKNRDKNNTLKQNNLKRKATLKRRKNI